MNGAESLVHTLLGSGVDTCFANPGTSEMHFVAALDRIPGMRCVLGLFEGVVTGAADGYARIAGKPAATLLHCGPGLGNGLANLHNGRRAGTRMVNCVGDQATYHRPLDAPLTADTEGLARAVSGWVRTATHAEHVGRDAAVAAQAAMAGNGTIATLILPSDTCWNPGGVVADRLPVPPAPQADNLAVRTIARLLREHGPETAIVIGGQASMSGPVADAIRIAAATGARLIGNGFFSRVERGRGRHAVERIPYPVDDAIASLAGMKHVVLVGVAPPVIFFAYPGKPGRPIPEDATVHVLARPEQDQPAALAALAAALDAPHVPVPEREPPQPARGQISPEAFACSLAALLPDQAIVIDESITFGRSLYGATHAAAPHDWCSVGGGAIGGGIPLATGAAVAGAGRRVVNLEADGSAMYTIQGLWTQARERLNVTTIVFNNRKYQILLGELANVGANPGPTALGMMDLGNPDIDFVRLANSLGVDAARAETMDQFNDLFAASTDRDGPFLIELMTA